MGNDRETGFAVFRGIQLARRLAVVGLLITTIVSTPAFAEEVPFVLTIRGIQYEGKGTLDNGQFNGAVNKGEKKFQLDGQIADDELTVRVTGSLMDRQFTPCDASGSASPPVGKVKMVLSGNCVKALGVASLELDLPAQIGGTTAVGSVLPPAPESAAQPPIDPIDEVYVALTPAKVQEKPDASSTLVKTLSAGQTITVVGRLKDRNWYLVSENDKSLGYVVADDLQPQQRVASATSAEPAVGAAQSGVPANVAELDFGRYQALVIGNDNYRNGLPVLKTAAGDAIAVAQVLKREYGFKVTLLTNATRAQILSALNQLRQSLTWDDNLLIYYAGHGSFDEAGDQGYWLPVDARAHDPTNWISNADITTMLKAIQARHIIVVADSCYSGSLSRDAMSDIHDASYLERIVQKKARTVLTSGGLEPVADAGGGGHSVFAAAFLATLQANKGIIDAETFFERVRKPVVLAASQTPEYSNLRAAGHEGGDFIFKRVGAQVAAGTSGDQVPWDSSSPADNAYPSAGTGGAAPVGSSQSGPTPAESALWNSIANSKDSADYRAYLRSYPGGVYASLAQSRIDSLSTAAGTALTASVTPIVTHADVVAKLKDYAVNHEPDVRAALAKFLVDHGSLTPEQSDIKNMEFTLSEIEPGRYAMFAKIGTPAPTSSGAAAYRAAVEVRPVGEGFDMTKVIYFHQE